MNVFDRSSRRYYFIYEFIPIVGAILFFMLLIYVVNDEEFPIYYKIVILFVFSCFLFSVVLVPYARVGAEINKIKKIFEEQEINVKARAVDPLSSEENAEPGVIIEWKLIGLDNNKLGITLFGYRLQGSAPHNIDEVKKRGNLIVNTASLNDGIYRDFDVQPSTNYFYVFYTGLIIKYRKWNLFGRHEFLPLVEEKLLSNLFIGNTYVPLFESDRIKRSVWMENERKLEELRKEILSDLDVSLKASDYRREIEEDKRLTEEVRRELLRNFDDKLTDIFTGRKK